MLKIYCIRQSKKILEGHTMSRPRSSFAPLNSNCPKQQRILNRCDQVDLQTLERRQELYTCYRGINTNQMLLIGQLMCIITPRKEEKPNTYTYYKRAKEQLTSCGHYHQIIVFGFCSETNTYQENSLFCVIQSSTSNTILFDIFLKSSVRARVPLKTT